MPLAKDLLHPSPEEEKRSHKKKRLVQSPNSYFMDVKCPEGQHPRVASSLLTSRLVFCRMLQDHNCVQPRPDGCAVCGLLHSSVSAHWRQSTSHRGVLIQEEAALVVLLMPP
uniref:40S ribosomal protein S27-like n=1 Tax=Oncorhynchus tshawytscha TaxID=74940 RepID=A0AAZ3RBR9_ONCTS